MLLMQDPKLLLLDEPVAGMTDEETERTAELFLSLEGSHSLVVVEHDMKFIDALTQATGKKVTVLHEGSVLAEGLAGARCRRTRRWSRSTLAAEAVVDAGRVPPRSQRRGSARLTGASTARSRSINQYYGGSHILRNVGFEAHARRGDRHARPQRRRQDDAAEEPDGRGAGQDRQHRVRRRRHHARRRRTSACARGIGYVPQGREIFAPPHGRGEPAHGPGLQARRHADAAPSCSSCSRCSSRCCTGAAATSPAASSSSSRSRARSPPGPSLLILDEPTEGIQPSIIKDIGRVIRMLADRGDMAIVLVEQYYDFAAELADQLPRDGARRGRPARPRRRHGEPRACAPACRSDRTACRRASTSTAGPSWRFAGPRGHNAVPAPASEWPMITVHHLNNSRSQRVLWLLEELGVDVRDPAATSATRRRCSRRPSCSKVHPLGKSPVITDDDVTVAESGAIVEYLLEQATATAAWSRRRARGAAPLHLLAALRRGLGDAAAAAEADLRPHRAGPMPFFVKPIARASRAR